MKCPDTCEHINTETCPYEAGGGAYCEHGSFDIEQFCTECGATRYGAAQIWVSDTGKICSDDTIFDCWAIDGNILDGYADCEGCGSQDCLYEEIY